jgi:uncharacterized membrane protein YidH (DUF202 family)
MNVSSYRAECSQPVFNLAKDVGIMMINHVKDLDPRGLSANSAHALFEKNLIFLKSFGVFVFIVIAIYRVYNYKEFDLIFQKSFFLESVLYGFFIALPFYILMKIRQTTISNTKIMCYAVVVGVFFVILNYLFEASGFMSFSFRDNKNIYTNDYIISDNDTRIVADSAVTALKLPDSRKDMFILVNSSALTLTSNVPIVSYGKEVGVAKSYTIPSNSTMKIVYSDGVYTVQDYSLMASLFPASSGNALTPFDQFIESFGFASKFILGLILMIPFITMVFTIPLSQRNLDVKYKNKNRGLIFFFLVETFLLFGILGSVPILYMTYNRHNSNEHFLESDEDRQEFIKTFFMNVLIMCLANIVFQTSGFYNKFLE